MKRLDRRGAICFIDLREVGASCPFDRQTMLGKFHAKERGVMLTGAAAFAAMWRAIPVLRPLGLIAKLPGISLLLEFFYRVFLRVRPRLQHMIIHGRGT